MKKGLITGIIALLIVLAISYFSGIWSFIYYLCGAIGLVSIVLSVDFLIYSLGNNRLSTSNGKSHKSRIEDSKKFISIAIPNLIAALIYIIN
ncbi:hypothetical protein Q8G31_26955 [Priestia megaterium]|uniref:DUF5316 family protein n=1 Tax=Priestia megaterium TaxID=1404 RepID=UPI002731CF5F|nr:DUF5316 family protein [Priestia megaterium]MDP1383358.1 hypothetical protein [Priestia megaterium]MDP1427506.1 hypothetical protein [Priestia megaterium]MEE3897027.1 DUF5316 family protein [Priestia megaterium]